MRRILQVLAWGVLGAMLAAALIGGAFVIAGTSLTEPASAVRVVGPPLRADRPDRHEPDHTPEADGTPDPGTPSPDPGAGSTGPLSGSLVPAASDDGHVERGDD
jgi:hypothetical protein